MSQGGGDTLPPPLVLRRRRGRRPSAVSKDARASTAARRYGARAGGWQGAEGQRVRPVHRCVRQGPVGRRAWSLSVRTAGREKPLVLPRAALRSVGLAERARSLSALPDGARQRRSHPRSLAGAVRRNRPCCREQGGTRHRSRTRCAGTCNRYGSLCQAESPVSMLVGSSWGNRCALARGRSTHPNPSLKGGAFGSAPAREAAPSCPPPPGEG